MSATDLIAIGIFIWLALIVIILWLYSKRRQEPEPVVITRALKLGSTQKPIAQKPVPQERAVSKPKIPTPQPQPDLPKPEPEPETPEPLPAPIPSLQGVRDDVRSMKHDVYAADRIFSPDKKFLRAYGYSRYWFVPLGEVRQREFYIAPIRNKNPLHVFLVWSACRLLRKACVTKIEPPEWGKPDIAFTKFNKAYAIEVETSRCINRDNILKKVQANNKIYGRRDWFFLVAASKQAKLYKRYARTMSRNQFVKWVKALK
jgi:hypothetical protein